MVFEHLSQSTCPNSTDTHLKFLLQWFSVLPLTPSALHSSTHTHTYTHTHHFFYFLHPHFHFLFLSVPLLVSLSQRITIFLSFSPTQMSRSHFVRSSPPGALYHTWVFHTSQSSMLIKLLNSRGIRRQYSMHHAWLLYGEVVIKFMGTYNV